MSGLSGERAYRCRGWVAGGRADRCPGWAAGRPVKR
jgi:hypothetical protein